MSYFKLSRINTVSGYAEASFACHELDSFVFVDVRLCCLPSVKPERVS